jgi:hypothetical protein
MEIKTDKSLCTSDRDTTIAFSSQEVAPSPAPDLV